MFSVALSLFLFLPGTALAQQEAPTVEYIRAEVEQVREASEDSDAAASVQVRITSGRDAGSIFILQEGIRDARGDMRLREGQEVILQRIRHNRDHTSYVLREPYRLPGVLVLLGLFFVLGILLCGRRGAGSILGLAVSISVLAFFVIPAILDGRDPLLIGATGAAAIAFISIYLAHGFNRRSTIALGSTLIALACTVGLAFFFVAVARLTGLGTESAVFLYTGPLQGADIRGLLLAGIILGALGVLDDVTTAQTAAVHELSIANKKMGFRQLYRAGTAIGREHIASLINTLALAYVGASLPMFLLIASGRDEPWWVLLNSEFIAEEIIRTLVGSTALLLAVPVSTWLAAHFFANGRAAVR